MTVLVPAAEIGLNATVSVAGAADAVSARRAENPPIRVIVTVALALGLTDSVPGSTAIAKLGGGALLSRAVNAGNQRSEIF